MEWVLLVLLALAIPVMGVVGFFMAMGARTEVRLLKARVQVLEQRLGLAPAAPEADGAAVPDPAPGVEAVADTAAPPPAAQDAIAPEPAPDQPPPDAQAEPAPLPAAARQSLEERIGTRWAVWLGGIALGLGGLFLVRAAIDQGLFGPGARIAAGTLFALALLGAGEWMRRRDAAGIQAAATGDGETAPVAPPRTLSLGILPPAPVPAVLTAAGILTAFGTAYAAHALYEMIGPATAFVVLGVIALSALAAAALHGPGLAAIGIVASYGAPLLVESSAPSPWPIILYVALVAASAYGLARVRLWLWLAIAGLAGAGLWTFVVAESFHGQALELVVHFALQTGLAAFFLVLAPHRGEADADVRPDPLGHLALALFALLAGYALMPSGFGLGRPVFAWVMLALLWGTALARPAVAAGGLMAAGVALAAMAAWPVAREIAAEPVTVLPGAPSSPPLPDALVLFLAFALSCGAALAVGAARRLIRGSGLPWIAAGCLAAAGAGGPVALLVAAWWRVSSFDRSIPFALAAAALALVFAAAARLFIRLEHAVADEGIEPRPAVVCGLEASAAGALAALAAGLCMVLDKGALTVALALSGLGAAWVTTRRPFGVLRYAVGAVGVAVLARLAWNPMVVSGDPGSLPVLNWLLFGYGVPALAFGLASVWLRRQKDDQVVALCEGLSALFAGLLLMTEIRHALTGTLDARLPGHVEAGLQVFASLSLAAVLVRLEAFRRSLVLRVASYLYGATGLAAAVAGLLVFANPLFESGQAVGGGILFNTLLPGYLLPAAAAVTLGRLARGRRPLWFVYAAAALGLVLHFLWLVIEVRHLFHGGRVAIWRSTGDAEMYSYSAAFLATGLALLAVGVWRRSGPARLASGLYILLTVGKVFLVDMSGLEGVWRALSFIGLGLALVGIGLVYQKLVFARPSAPPPPPPAGPDAEAPGPA